MMSDLSEKSCSDGKTRFLYHKPHLCEYGSLTNLTLNGVMDGTGDNINMNNNMSAPLP